MGGLAGGWFFTYYLSKKMLTVRGSWLSGLWVTGVILGVWEDVVTAGQVSKY